MRQFEQMSLVDDDEPIITRYHGNKQLSKVRRQHREAAARGTMERPFVAWDGEGWNDEKGRHKYVLLANSLGQRIIADHGKSLSQKDVFKFFMDTKRAVPDAYHVVYGGNYDFNMIIKGNGLHPNFAKVLYLVGAIVYDNYIVRYTPKRILQVTETQFSKPDEAIETASFTLYDVLPFFQTSFVKACDSYLGTDWFERDTIIAQKKERGNFSWDKLDEIIYYNDAELVNLVALMNELRQRLFDAGLLVSKWYGPGAIAELMFRRNNVKNAMDQTYHETKPELAAASRAAYSGGRFELIRPGHSSKPVYEYDINSAYPYAMTKLPNLQRGKWRHVNRDPGDVHFGVYHAQFHMARLPDYEHIPPQPLFARLQGGQILYPTQVSGWYWSPEIRVARNYVERHGGELRIDQAWIFEEADPSDRPMAFIEEYYRQRQLLKRLGNGAQVGIKLGLNSLYGKMAQQVGYDPDKKRLPPFHQLEWAGWVTSHCRAQLLEAVVENLDEVVAFETDAVFSLCELPRLRVGNGLGEWERVKFSNMTYLQSGLRFGDLEDGTPEPRTRGFSELNMSRGDIVNGLLDGVWSIEVPDRKFITIGTALYQNFHEWCQWKDSTKTVELMEFNMGSKRVHLNAVQCLGCANTFEMGYKPIIRPDAWHETWVPWLEMVENSQHAVLWVNPDEHKAVKQRLENYDEHEVLF